MKRLIVAAVLTLSVAACGAEEEPSASPSPSASAEAVVEEKAATATEMAEAIKAKVPEVGKVVTITEDNDPNGKIGRPDGYVDGAVMFDSRAEPVDAELGVDQGATLEVWPDEKAATERAEFIQSTLDEADGLLGSEYHYQSGAMLLRVSGSLKPSEAAAYAAAWETVSSSR